jgi:prepilin-type N-terminal cleavage/methylation domain-containing protein
VKISAVPAWWNPGNFSEERVMKKEQGFTLIELLIVVAIISIIAAIAVPGLMRAKMAGNEVSAIASMRTITVSETAYSAGCGNSGYAVSLVTLGAAPGGSGEGFLSADLTSSNAVIKAGYTIALAAGKGAAVGVADCNTTPTQSAYYATAIPQTLGSTGSRSFATNQGNSVWQAINTLTPPTEPFTLAAGSVFPI